MMLLVNRIVALFTACLLGAHAPSAAGAPLDGELTLLWWANDFEADILDADVDAGAVGLAGELWADRWGVGGGLFRSDLKNTSSDGDVDYLSVDVKRRFLAATENNYLALGVGWESIDFGDGTDTDGPRLLLEGRVGLTPVLYLYGQTAWLPALQTTAGRDDPDGFELEAGLSVTPFPYLSFRAGYRQIRLDFKNTEGANESTKSKGVVLGAGVHW